MHAFHAVKLDVGGGRRARDPGERMARLAYRIVELGDGLGDESDDLIDPDDAEVIVGQEGRARRPWPGPPSRTIVPVCAIPSRQAVKTPSLVSSC